MSSSPPPEAGCRLILSDKSDCVNQWLTVRDGLPRRKKSGRLTGFFEDWWRWRELNPRADTV